MAGNTIVQLTDFGSPVPGNFIPCITALQEPLQSAGLRQVLVLPARARERSWAQNPDREGKLPVHFLSGTNPLAITREVASLVRRENAVLMHTHFSPSDNISVLARGWLRLTHPLARGCRLIWHIHSAPTALGIPQKVIGLLKYRVLAHSVFLIPVSPGVLDGLAARGVPRSRCRLVLNGLDLAWVTTRTSSREEVRAKLSIPLDKKLLLAFSYNPRVKGGDLALDAVERLCGEFPQFVLLLIGREKLRDYLRERFGSATPAWLRVAEPEVHVANYYGASDCFLSPSRSEGFAYAIPEAIINRLPVIASDTPGQLWARALKSVHFFPSGNAEGLAEQIFKVMNQTPSDQNASIEHDIEYIRRKHSVESWAAQILDVYREALGIR